MTDLIQVRRGTTAQWTAANPILAEGEPGFDTTTGDFKVGNGVTAWASLTGPTNSRYTLTDVPWIGVSGGVGFTNSWVDFGSGARDAEYRKVGDSVEVRGLIKSGTVGSGTPAFTLPVGYRPTASCNYATNSNGLFGSLQVLSTGTVAVTAGSNVFAALDPIRFSVL